MKSASFSTRIALYFGVLFLAAMGSMMLLGYFGLPWAGLTGASHQQLADATRTLELSAGQQRDSIRNALESRRGDARVLSENKVIVEQLNKRDITIQQNMERVFNRLQRAYPDAYQGLQMVDPQSGRIRASSVPDEVGALFSDAALISRAAQPGATELVEQMAMPQGQVLVIVRQIHTPEADGYPSGKLAGILVVYLDMTHLLTRGMGVDREGDGPPGTSLLFGHGGQMLAKYPPSDTQDAVFRRDDRVANGFEGTLLLPDGRDGELLVVYRHLQLSGAQGWTLVHYQSKQEALGGLNRSALALVLAGLLCTVAGLLLIGMAARHVTRPLKQLATVARRLDAGDWSVRMQADRRHSREVAEMADAFNAMAEHMGQDHQRLEARVIERTVELARSNADLEMFAYAASHDLQEPLRSVSSCVQLLQKRYAGALDARADEFMAHAVGGSLRMQALIDDLLAYSRVSAAPRVLAAIDSTVALDAACANLVSAITQGSAQISHGQLPHVQADAGQLAKLFQNLVGNALKFRGDRAAVVHVSAQQVADKWVFAVADQGIGIEPQYFERIFRLFQRLHTRDEYAGTGIGLTICHKIVERHGGRIWLESAFGQGTTFYFTLPLVGQPNRNST